MSSTYFDPTTTTPKVSLWAGRAMMAFFTLFMAFDTAVKLLRLPVVDETLGPLGWDAGSGLAIGIIDLVLMVLYLIPRTAILGAVLLTGMFGGAMATQLRVHAPLFSHVLFGLYLGLLAWGGLWLRDARLRALFPVIR